MTVNVCLLIEKQSRKRKVTAGLIKKMGGKMYMVKKQITEVDQLRNLLRSFHNLRHALSSEDHCLFSQPLLLFPPFFLSFFFFFFFFSSFCLQGCNRNIIYFTFAQTKISLLHKFFPMCVYCF